MASNSLIKFWQSKGWPVNESFNVYERLSVLRPFILRGEGDLEAQDIKVRNPTYADKLVFSYEISSEDELLKMPISLYGKDYTVLFYEKDDRAAISTLKNKYGLKDTDEDLAKRGFWIYSGKGLAGGDSRDKNYGRKRRKDAVMFNERNISGITGRDITIGGKRIGLHYSVQDRLLKDSAGAISEIANNLKRVYIPKKYKDVLRHIEGLIAYLVKNNRIIWVSGLTGPARYQVIRNSETGKYRLYILLNESLKGGISTLEFHGRAIRIAKELVHEATEILMEKNGSDPENIDTETAAVLMELVFLYLVDISWGWVVDPTTSPRPVYIGSSKYIKKIHEPNKKLRIKTFSRRLENGTFIRSVLSELFKQKKRIRQIAAEVDKLFNALPENIDAKERIRNIEKRSIETGADSRDSPNRYDNGSGDIPLIVGLLFIRIRHNAWRLSAGKLAFWSIILCSIISYFIGLNWIIPMTALGLYVFTIIIFSNVTYFSPEYIQKKLSSFALWLLVLGILAISGYGLISFMGNIYSIVSAYLTISTLKMGLIAAGLLVLLLILVRIIPRLGEYIKNISIRFSIRNILSPAEDDDVMNMLYDLNLDIDVSVMKDILYERFSDAGEMSRFLMDMADFVKKVKKCIVKYNYGEFIVKTKSTELWDFLSDEKDENVLRFRQILASSPIFKNKRIFLSNLNGEVLILTEPNKETVIEPGAAAILARRLLEGLNRIGDEYINCGRGNPIPTGSILKENRIFSGSLVTTMDVPSSSDGRPKGIVVIYPVTSIGLNRGPVKLYEMNGSYWRAVFSFFIKPNRRLPFKIILQVLFILENPEFRKFPKMGVLIQLLENYYIGFTKSITREDEYNVDFLKTLNFLIENVKKVLTDYKSQPASGKASDAEPVRKTVRLDGSRVELGSPVESELLNDALKFISSTIPDSNTLHNVPELYKNIMLDAKRVVEYLTRVKKRVVWAKGLKGASGYYIVRSVYTDEYELYILLNERLQEKLKGLDDSGKALRIAKELVHEAVKILMHGCEDDPFGLHTEAAGVIGEVVFLNLANKRKKWTNDNSLSDEQIYIGNSRYIEEIFEQNKIADIKDLYRRIEDLFLPRQIIHNMRRPKGALHPRPDRIYKLLCNIPARINEEAHIKRIEGQNEEGGLYSSDDIDYVSISVREAAEQKRLEEERRFKQDIFIMLRFLCGSLFRLEVKDILGKLSITTKLKKRMIFIWAAIFIFIWYSKGILWAVPPMIFPAIALVMGFSLIYRYFRQSAAGEPETDSDTQFRKITQITKAAIFTLLLGIGIIITGGTGIVLYNAFTGFPFDIVLSGVVVITIGIIIGLLLRNVILFFRRDERIGSAGEIIKRTFFNIFLSQMDKVIMAKATAGRSAYIRFSDVMQSTGSAALFFYGSMFISAAFHLAIGYLWKLSLLFPLIKIMLVYSSLVIISCIAYYIISFLIYKRYYFSIEKHFSNQLRDIGFNNRQIREISIILRLKRVNTNQVMELLNVLEYWSDIVRSKAEESEFFCLDKSGMLWDFLNSENPLNRRFRRILEQTELVKMKRIFLSNSGGEIILLSKGSLPPNSISRPLIAKRLVDSLMVIENCIDPIKRTMPTGLRIDTRDFDGILLTVMNLPFAYNQKKRIAVIYHSETRTIRLYDIDKHARCSILTGIPLDSFKINMSNILRLQAFFILRYPEFNDFIGTELRERLQEALDQKNDENLGRYIEEVKGNLVREFVDVPDVTEYAIVEEPSPDVRTTAELPELVPEPAEQAPPHTRPATAELEPIEPIGPVRPGDYDENVPEIEPLDDPDKGPGAIMQPGTNGEAFKEFQRNREEGRYNLLSDKQLKNVQRVARDKGISLDGIRIYAINSIVKARNDFVHGYFDRGRNELFLSTDIMERANSYDLENGSKLLDEYIEHELRCAGSNHQELRRQQRRDYMQYGNYSNANDEGRLRDVIRKYTDIAWQRLISGRFIDKIKAMPAKQEKKRIILALDTDIGNMTQFEIGKLLEQIRDVSSLWSNIEFIADRGEGLANTIKKAIGGRDNIDVIVVTKREKKEFDKSYSIMRVNDNQMGDSGSYVSILELLTFALVLNYGDDILLLKQLYSEIAGEELTDELIGNIRHGEHAIPLLPKSERIPLDFYNESVEVLKSA